LAGHRDRDLRDFIANVRAAVIAQHPSRQDYFDIYANEALFGFSIIKNDINALPQNAIVLEVGSGILLLSGYLASLELRVHALEPIAAGFSHFRELQNAVLKHYEEIGLQLPLIKSTIETFFNTEFFDYIFSVNVFEHIDDVERGLSNAYLSLKHRGVLRVYCPNYHFPYEPHFNIPTLVSKKLTEFVFRNSIMNSPHVAEARETWDALNWINVTQVKRLFYNRFGTKPIFNQLATYLITMRVLDDRHFSERRSKWVTSVLRAFDKAGLLHFFKFLPVIVSPVMDFRVERGPDKE
jgi:SAM-dependent methyltransferase